MRSDKMQEYVDRVVALAPPLTSEQRARIYTLIGDSKSSQPVTAELDELSTIRAVLEK